MLSEMIIEKFFAQFPIAFVLGIVGYFFIGKLENYNKAIMEIAINSTKAIENCTHMMQNIDDNMKEIRSTQLEISKEIYDIKVNVKK
jgi:hypothetical protein